MKELYARLKHLQQTEQRHQLHVALVCCETLYLSLCSCFVLAWLTMCQMAEFLLAVRMNSHPHDEMKESVELVNALDTLQVEIRS